MRRGIGKILLFVGCSFIVVVFIGSLITVIIVQRSMSIVSLSANPQGDATSCVQHPSSMTCSQQVSPFGTQKPGAPSCADHASLPGLIALSDPMENEAPLVTLQVWYSPACHAWFASAYTSTLILEKY